MAMIALKCECCGAAIELVDPQGFATCPYCETRMMLPSVHSEASFGRDREVQKILNIAKITRSPFVPITAMEQLLKRAQDFERFGQPDLARKSYRELADQYPESHQGWFGLARLCEWELSDSDACQEDGKLLPSGGEYSINAVKHSSGTVRQHIFDVLTRKIDAETDREDKNVQLLKQQITPTSSVQSAASTSPSGTKSLGFYIACLVIGVVDIVPSLYLLYNDSSGELALFGLVLGGVLGFYGLSGISYWVDVGDQSRSFESPDSQFVKNKKAQIAEKEKLIEALNNLREILVLENKK